MLPHPFKFLSNTTTLRKAYSLGRVFLHVHLTLIYSDMPDDANNPKIAILDALNAKAPNKYQIKRLDLSSYIIRSLANGLPLQVINLLFNKINTVNTKLSRKSAHPRLYL